MEMTMDNDDDQRNEKEEIEQAGATS